MLRSTLMGLLFLSVVAFSPYVEAAPLAVMDVTASDAQLPNVPENTLDGDFGTRWSAQGDGQTITYELEVCSTVGALKIAWYQGDTRVAFFDVEVSEDGASWVPVHSGESAGNTLALETVDIDDTAACFVRIVGHGNNSSRAATALWNSITEVVIEDATTESVETVDIPLPLLEQICAPLLAQ